MAPRLQTFGKDGHWLIAGIVGAVLVPGLTFGLAMPFLFALGIGAAAFCGLVLILSPRRLFEGLDVSKVGRGRVEFARSLLAEAVPAAERLTAAADRLKDRQVALKVRHLAEIAEDVFRKVGEKPESVASVRRFLSYYLPRAADVAESFETLETRRKDDPRRRADLVDMIDKLDNAFVHYADSMADTSLALLDTDLRLIKASLKEDLPPS